MSLSVGELVGTLRLDDKGFTKGIADAKGQMRGLGDQSEQAAQRSGASWKQMAVGIGATFAAAKLADFTKQTISAAASAEQAVGGTAAVFGESAAQIDEYAKHSDTSLGLSERAFRDLTTVAGAQLKNLGFSVDEAATQSIKLTEIGADLAATYGGTTQEAVEALGAAFRGEADPAERFGLSLNQTAVNAKAVEMGLAQSTSAVDAQAKAQATLALIMEQTTDAQGQFARESDTASGQAQRLTAQWENMQAELGQKLLPILTKVGEVLSGVMGNGAATAGVAVAALAGAALYALPKLAEMRDTVRNMDGGFSRLGKVAGVAGAAGGVIGLVGALDAMEEAKNAENVREMAEAFVGFGDAAEDTWKQILGTWVGPTVLRDVFNELKTSNVEAAERLLVTAEAAGVAAGTIEELRGELDTKRQADAQGAVDQENYTEATEEATAAIDGQAEAVQSLSDALDGLLSKFFDSEQAMIAQQDAIAAVDEHLKEMREEYGSGAMSLDLNTEAGRRNREMLSELFTATGDTITAMRDSGATSEELRAQWALDRGELSAVIERFRAAGVDVSAYDALLAQIDAVVETDVQARTDAAAARLDAIKQKIFGLDGSTATVTITEVWNRVQGSIFGGGPSGKRALGGPVSAGGVYEVTEGGIPELLVDGGRKYLLPGKGGHVETIDKAMTRMAGTVSAAPMAAGGGGAGSTPVVIDMRGAIVADDRQFQRMVVDAIGSAGRKGVTIAVRGRTL